MSHSARRRADDVARSARRRADDAARARRTGARRVLASLLLLFAMVVAVAALSDSPTPPLAHPYPNELPDGEGRVLAERACLMCHAATLITQQAKDSTAWSKTVATMVKWGAPLPTAEQDTVVRYLSAHLGPRERK